MPYTLIPLVFFVLVAGKKNKKNLRLLEAIAAVSLLGKNQQHTQTEKYHLNISIAGYCKGGYPFMFLRQGDKKKKKKKNPCFCSNPMQPLAWWARNNTNR